MLSRGASSLGKVRIQLPQQSNASSWKRNYAVANRSSTKNALIVGATLEGLTAALALRRKGIQAMIIDSRPAKELHVHDISSSLAPYVILPPNATWVLHQLGITHAHLAPFVCPITVYRAVSSWGMPFYNHDWLKVCEKFYLNKPVADDSAVFFSVKVSDLEQLLMKTVTSVSEPGPVQEIRFGENLRGIKFREVDDKYVCHFRKDYYLTRTFDVVVGADGVGSKVLDFCSENGQQQDLASSASNSNSAGSSFIGIENVQIIMKKPAGLAISDREMFDWWGPGRHFSVFPIRSPETTEPPNVGPNPKYDPNQIIVCQASSRVPAPQKQISSGPAGARYVHNNFKRFKHHGMDDILLELKRDSIMQHIKINNTNFYNFQAKSDHVGQCVVIGRAAHTINPSLFQDAAVGIEDAFVLARQIARSDATTAQCVSSYSKERASRVKLISTQSANASKTVHFQDFAFGAGRLARRLGGFLGLHLYHRYRLQRLVDPRPLLEKSSN